MWKDGLTGGGTTGTVTSSSATLEGKTPVTLVTHVFCWFRTGFRVVSGGYTGVLLVTGWFVALQTGPWQPWAGKHWLHWLHVGFTGFRLVSGWLHKRFAGYGVVLVRPCRLAHGDARLLIMMLLEFRLSIGLPLGWWLVGSWKVLRARLWSQVSIH